MTSIVEILEGIGADAQLRHATGKVLAEKLTQDAIEPQALAAILASDRSVLEAITGCRVIAHKVISPGKEDDEDEDDTPERKDDEIRAPRIDVLAPT